MAFAPIPLLLASRTGRSAYFAASRRHGPCLYTVLHRRVLPALFGDPEEEYWALRTGVVRWDVGIEIPIEVSGPDALDFINWAMARDFTKCPVGGSRYTFLVDERGGVVNDPVVLRLDEDRFWLMPSDSDLLLWLKALACASSRHVTVAPVDTAPLQVRVRRRRTSCASCSASRSSTSATTGGPGQQSTGSTSSSLARGSPGS